MEMPNFSNDKFGSSISWDSKTVTIQHKSDAIQLIQQIWTNVSR